MLLTACDSATAPDCFKSTGATRKEFRIVPKGDRDIYLKNIIDLVLSAGKSDTLWLEGGKNLLPEISVEKEGTGIVLKNKNSCNFVRSYSRKLTAYHKADDITVIRLLGSGKISCKDTLRGIPGLNLTCQVWEGSGTMDLKINTPTTTLDNSGTAEILAAGYTNFLLLSTNSYGKIDAHRLNADSAILKVEGTADVQVSVNKKLIINQLSKANVYCYGKPSHVRIYGNGGGKLIYR